MEEGELGERGEVCSKWWSLWSKWQPTPLKASSLRREEWGMKGKCGWGGFLGEPSVRVVSPCEKSKGDG